MSKTITPEELNNALKCKKDILILDVRRRSDYEVDPKMIPGAIWRDPENVDQWSRELPKGKYTVIYCVRGGSVSQSVSSRLMERDVQASYIEGGITAWKELGGEVEAE
jgi:rhodanese-related sulfurtransferase